MRVLLLTSTFHPMIGGAETYAILLIRALVAHGATVMVVTDGLAPVTATDEWVLEGVTIVRTHRYRGWLADEEKVAWEQLAFGILNEIVTDVAGFRPEVVISNGVDSSVLAKIASLTLEIPWVASFHEQDPGAEPFGQGRLRLVYGALNPELVLAGSEFYAQRARQWGRASSVALIYHGIDTSVFRPDDAAGASVRGRYGVSEDDFFIVSAARFKPRKGLHHLIEAIAMAREDLGRFRVVLAGTVNSASRDYADSLREMVMAASLENLVLFDECVAHSGIPALLSAADVVVQPSLAEGLGLSVLEGMACAKAIITTDIDGIREILTIPDIAMVVPPNSPGDIAKALVHLRRSPAAVADMGRRARAHVEECFSFARMAAETVRRIQGLIRG